MKKFLIGLLLLTFVLPVFGQNQDEFKFSLVPRRLAIPAMTGYVTTDGLTLLTADWNVGAFNLTAKNYTAAETLGAELITNFAGFTPDVGGDWSYAAGAWTHIGVGYNILTANWQPTVGHWYKVQYQASNTSGLTVFTMGGSNFHYLATAAVQTYYVYATNTNAPLWGAYTGFTGNLSGFSVKEVTNGTLTTHNIEPTGAVILQEGSGAAPSLSFAANRGTGLFCYSDQYLEVTVNGSNCVTFGKNGPIINGSDGLTIGGSNLFLKNGGAAILQLGADAAAPVAQTLKAHDGVGSNIAGAALTLAGGNGTGSGVGGALNFKTTPAGGAGSSENTSTTRMSIASTGLIETTDAPIKISYSPTNSYYGYLKATAAQGFTLSCGTDGVLAGLVVGVSGMWPVGDVNFTLGDPSYRFSSFYTQGIKHVGTGPVEIIPAQITVGTGTGLTVNSAGNLNQLVYNAVVSYAGFSSAGSLTADKTIATLPAKTKIIRIYARTTTPFAGTGVTDVDLCVGKSAGGTEYIATHDVFSAAYNAGDLDADMGTELTRAAAIQGGSVVNWTGTTTVVARITTTTAHTDDLTAGSVTFIIETARY